MTNKKLTHDERNLWWQVGLKQVNDLNVQIDLRGAYLVDADLRGVDLEDANLADANLTNANLTGADLVDADLRDADLCGANLRGANLRGATLRGADLTGANLSGATLRGAYLCGANLSGATLRGADLWGANLRGADLRGADLTGANLSSANTINTKILHIPAIGSKRGDDIYASPVYNTDGEQMGWGYHLGCYYSQDRNEVMQRLKDARPVSYVECFEMLCKMCEMVYGGKNDIQ